MGWQEPGCSDFDSRDLKSLLALPNYVLGAAFLLSWYVVLYWLRLNLLS